MIYSIFNLLKAFEDALATDFNNDSSVEEVKESDDFLFKKNVNVDKDGKVNIELIYSGSNDNYDKKTEIVSELNNLLVLTKDHKNIHVKFTFGDEIFYFDYDNKEKKFKTVDPNNDVFYYNPEDETLISYVEDKDEHEDDLDDDYEVECEVDLDDDDDEEHPCGYNFEVKDDANLAFNLKNSLKKWAENNDKKCTECLFCGIDAADRFVENIIKTENYDVEFDDENNPISINFSIYNIYCDDIFEEYDLTSIYHNESDNLDMFCEEVKERYNFSLGSWDVEFCEDNKDVVENIRFTFAF